MTIANTFTFLETVKTSDGNTILYDLNESAHFFRNKIEENYNTFTSNEKEEFFEMQQKYGDIFDIIFKEPLHNALAETNPVGWVVQDVKRNPIEEYEYFLTKSKDEDMTDSEHNLKFKRLLEHKLWFEKQNT